MELDNYYFYHLVLHQMDNLLDLVVHQHIYCTCLDYQHCLVECFPLGNPFKNKKKKKTIIDLNTSRVQFNVLEWIIHKDDEKYDKLIPISIWYVRRIMRSRWVRLIKFSLLAHLCTLWWSYVLILWIILIRSSILIISLLHSWTNKININYSCF